MRQKASEEDSAIHAVCPPSTNVPSTQSVLLAQTLTLLRTILSASVVDVALPSQLSHVVLRLGG